MNGKPGNRDFVPQKSNTHSLQRGCIRHWRWDVSGLAAFETRRWGRFYRDCVQSKAGLDVLEHFIERTDELGRAQMQARQDIPRQPVLTGNA